MKLTVIIAALAALITGPALGEPIRALKKTYALPVPSVILGPLAITCPDTTKCLDIPDTLETAHIGRRLTLETLQSAKTGDYLLGTATELGVPGPKAVRTEFYEFLGRASEAYDAKLRSASDQNLSVQEQAELTSTRPEMQDLPEWLREELIRYPANPAAKRCGIPLGALAAVRSDPRFDANDAAARRRVTLIGLLQHQFRTHCLSINRELELKLSLRRLVYFGEHTDESGALPFFCSGYVLGYDLVITARHCLVNSDRLQYLAGDQAQFTNGTSGTRFPLKVRAGTAAVVFGKMDRSYAYEIPDLAFNRSRMDFDPVADAGADYVIVRLLGFDPTRFPQAPAAAPEVGRPARIPGFYVPQTHVLLLADKPGSGKQLTEDLLGAIRVDTSPLCRIIKIQNSCIVHTCQTEGGYSGTPIFQKKIDGSFILVGLHAGYFSQKYPACDFGRGDYFPNYGVRLPIDEIAGALDERWRALQASLHEVSVSR